MKIALAQINPIIGDFEYNLSKIFKSIDFANNENADLIVFSELALCGYPPKDLLLKKQFVEDNKKYLDTLKRKVSSNIAVIIGFPEENKNVGKPLFNSLALVHKNSIVCTSQKVLLPTYDVFDEERYFEPGKKVKSIELFNKKIGLSICEDIWHNSLEWAKPRYHFDPIQELVKEKIDLLVNSSSSPYFIGKPQLRENVLKHCAKNYKIPIIYVNQVGGNDQLIFDGNSCIIDQNGDISLKLKSFEEDFQVFDLNELRVLSFLTPSLQLEEELLQAIICGLRNYIAKCGFKKVIVGLSGGIDSALTVVLAVLAISKENVLGVLMPSRYTSTESIKDAHDLANNLGIEITTISIEESFKTFLKILEPFLESKNPSQQVSTAQENIQPRIRGTILMALSNQSGALVLSTGNKSELATGYCTLYGDMCGGLSLISDLPKTMVYKLASYINKKYKSNLIPENIITKMPTAELKPNQKDQDVLPPYEILDQILNAYVEEHLPLKEIIKDGIPKETIQKVCNMIDKSEYKREQAAPGLKLTNRSFGHGWRMPIAQQYREQI